MREIKLPFTVKKPMLACGADLKGAFAFAKGSKAFFDYGFGDLGKNDGYAEYDKSLRSCEKRLGIRPELVVCDMHPGYFSTRFAEDYAKTKGNLRVYRVQHHEAHVAATAVDHMLDEKVIGVAFDGTGYGTDGTVWGGEFFFGDAAGFVRIAHIAGIKMPGGEMAIRQPWRMALSYLIDAYGEKLNGTRIGLLNKVKPREAEFLRSTMERNINAPITSSAGRLFDAVGSIIFARRDAKFEAELPIELERIALRDCSDAYEYKTTLVKGVWLIDVSETIRGIVTDLQKKRSRELISAKFHNTMAGIIVQTSVKACKKFGVKKVVISGGVFQNHYLRKRVSALFNETTVSVFEPEHILTNDAGIPIGQIAIANAREICV